MRLLRELGKLVEMLSVNMNVTRFCTRIDESRAAVARFTGGSISQDARWWLVFHVRSAGLYSFHFSA